MQKETKSNLIFLIILLVVLTPGAVILVKKKLDPKSRVMGGPDPVRSSTAYVDPFKVPENFRRLVPPAAEEWVKTLMPTHLGRTPTSVPSDKGGPLVSEGKMFEVLSVARNPLGIQSSVLVWNLPNDKQPSLVKAKAAVGKQVLDATSAKIIKLQIPREVQEELRAAGFIRPPSQAAIVTAQFSNLPNPTYKTPIELMVQVYVDEQSSVDFVRVFTNPEEISQ